MSNKKSNMLCSILLLCASCSGGNVELSSYMGQPNNRYFYESSDKSTMHVDVYRVDNRNEIIEIVDLPLEAKVDGITDIRSKYLIEVNDDALIKKTEDDRTILIKAPRNMLGNSWEVEGIEIIDGEKKKFFINCNAKKASKIDVLGENVDAIVVNCFSDRSSYEFHTKITYAKNFGMVEKYESYKTNTGESLGDTIVKLVSVSPMSQ